MSKIDTLIEIAQDIRALLDRKLVGKPLHCAKCEHQSGTILTKQQAMDYLHITESTYYRWIQENKLQPRGVLGRDHYYESDLLAMKDRRRHRERG